MRHYFILSLLILFSSTTFAASTLSVTTTITPTLDASHPLDTSTSYTFSYTISGQGTRLTTYDITPSNPLPAGTSINTAASTCVLNQKTTIAGTPCTVVFIFNPLAMDQSLISAKGNLSLQFATVTDMYNSQTLLNDTVNLVADNQIISVSTTPDTHIASQFSMNVCFKMGNVALSNWAFGFYMPRSFVRSPTCPASPTVNCDMSITITPAPNCQATNAEQALASVSKAMATANNLPGSAGYTTILAPVDADDHYQSYPLAANQTYLIHVVANNQWAPVNLSAMPQGFFLIDNVFAASSAGKPIYNFPDAASSAYSIGGYDPTTVASNITQHVNTNWQQSQTLSSSNLADYYHLVPTPASIVQLAAPTVNNAVNNQTIRIYCEPSLCPTSLALSYLQTYFTQLYGASAVSVVTDPTTANVLLNYDDTTAANEKYVLSLTGSKVTMTAYAATDPALDAANANAGWLYAIETFKQLMFQTQNNFATTSQLNLHITDQPRFVYRGITLDVARHFFTTTEIKQLLDIMLANKLNTLHLHLSDDEGFRLALADLPALGIHGGWRGFVTDSYLPPLLFLQGNLDLTNATFNLWYPHANSAYPAAQTDSNPLPGTYSADDITDLLAYANQRNITIIPEVDLPAHAYALSKADPEAFVDNTDVSEYISVQGYQTGVLPICLYGANNTFNTEINQMVATVIHEFSGQTSLYAQNEFSVGGDEVSADAYSNYPECLNNGFADKTTALAKVHYFFTQLAAHINQTTATKFSGWEETVSNTNGTLDTDNIIPAAQTGHIWAWLPAGSDPTAGGLLLAKNLLAADYPTVLAFADYEYFDLTYTPEQEEPGFSWATSFSDTHAALSIVQAIAQLPTSPHLLGIEGALWGENMTNLPHLTYMALPKMMGLAEAAWAPAVVTNSNSMVDWQSLACRLQGNQGFLSYLQQGFTRDYPNDTLTLRAISKELPSSYSCTAAGIVQ